MKIKKSFYSVITDDNLSVGALQTLLRDWEHKNRLSIWTVSFFILCVYWKVNTVNPGGRGQGPHQQAVSNSQNSIMHHTYSCNGDDMKERPLTL